MGLIRDVLLKGLQHARRPLCSRPSLLFLLIAICIGLGNYVNSLSFSATRERHCFFNVLTPKHIYSTIRPPDSSSVRSGITWLFASPDSNETEDSGVTQESRQSTASKVAAGLRDEARRMREEADQLNKALTRDKIETFERQLEQLQLKENSQEQVLDIQSQISRLQERLNPKRETTPTETSNKVEDTNIQVQESLPINETSTNSINTTAEESFFNIFIEGGEIESIPGDEVLAGALKEIPVVNRLMEQVADMLGKDNVTLVELIEAMENLEGSNQTLLGVVKDEVTFTNAFPDIITYTEPKGLTKADMKNIFIPQVLTKELFRPTAKAVRVPGGFYITGVNQMDSGDKLIEEIDKRMKIYFPEQYADCQVNYIRDLKTFLDMDDMQMADAISETEGIVIDIESMLGGALYITTSDLEPAFPVLFRYALSAAGVATTSLFATSCYMGVADADVLDLLTLENIQYGLTTPLFFALMGIQVAHELGHAAAAGIQKLKIQVPYLIPSPSFGSMGAVTPLSSSPSNVKGLFDFAIAGPLSGMLASASMLWVGLQSTLQMSQAQVDQLPRLSEEVLKLSTLGTSMIESVMGSDVLSILDLGNTMIPCHPLTIAGYVGIIMNALHLLPLPSTDGGRIAHAVYGRNTMSEFPRWIGVISLTALTIYEFQTTQLPFAFSILTLFFMNQSEIPLRNEVDPLDAVRLAFSIAIAFLVSVSLCPVF